AWFKPDGGEMDDEAWQQSFGKALGVYVNGAALRERDPDGRPVRDARFLVLFNAHSEPVTFTLPASNWVSAWTRVIATDDARGEGGGTRLNAGEAHEVGGRSVVVLQAEG
ncbi:MAG TPA: hypothetical protein VGQ10_06515, partial [Vicinamibacterales bacterium]|nr:hypothetical protein [Vicinamibacterales bacterium]